MPAISTAPAPSDPPAPDAIAPLVRDPIASRRHYALFSEQLPYNTTNPETQQRQRTLLTMLDTHDICNERTFRIFIAEPLQHEADAAQILDQLFQLNVVQTTEEMDDDEGLLMEPLRDGEETDTTAEPVPLSPASQISTLTSAMGLGSPTATAATEPPSTTIDAEQLFPIFRRETAIAESPTSTSRSANTLTASATAERKSIAWRAYGRDARQLQLDAGQRRFGGAQCAECGMFYARHEPEDEALHQRYHDLSGRLQFRGWQDERVVCEVPEWGGVGAAGGRIVCVQRSDAKAKRTRAAEIVRLVDEALGVPREEEGDDGLEEMGAQSVVSVGIGAVILYEYKNYASCNKNEIPCLFYANDKMLCKIL